MNVLNQAESKDEAKDEAKSDTKDEAKSEAKSDTKDEAKSEAKEETKSEAKDETKEETKDETKDTKKVFVDPSEKRANDLQKFSSEPLKFPGTEVLEVEPKATAAAVTIVGILVDKLLNPNLVKTIIDNIIANIDLSLASKKNKLEHLAKDKSFGNSEIIKQIHSQSGGNSFFTKEECSFF